MAKNRTILSRRRKRYRGSRWKKKLFALLVFAVMTAAGWLAGKFGQSSFPKSATTKTIEVSESIVQSSPASISDYGHDNVIILNDDIPCFTAEDAENITGEEYSDLDLFGRCGPATAMLHRSMMPKEERGSIGQVKPSGWKQAKYPGVIDSEPAYLYNRCHLIAFAMTGQNANPQNLITGTRYMNTELMLPYEEQVLRYLDNSDNHVLYRVSPYFKDIEMVARGVEMEAYSVEDDGAGVCFHVFVYNVQPGIKIDYLTGASSLE